MYLNSSVPFGARSSCKIFNDVADLLEWIIVNESGKTYISHFLDDYPLFERTKPLLEQFVAIFLDVMGQIGMPIAHEKTIGPTQNLEYLGLMLNLRKQQLLIPEKKINQCLQDINKFLKKQLEKKTVTVKEIQKLAGRLCFISAVCPEGKTYLKSLYNLTRSSSGQTCKATDRRHISLEVAGDLDMFKCFLHSPFEVLRSIPFSSQAISTVIDFNIYTDAAGQPDKGARFICENEYVFLPWQETNLFNNKGFMPSIALLEGIGAVLSVFTWSDKFRGKTLRIHCDNQSIVSSIAKRKSNIPAIMELIKKLSVLCLQNQILPLICHIPGEKNTIADSISRRWWDLVTSLAPATKQISPSQELWPVGWMQHQTQCSKMSLPILIAE